MTAIDAIPIHISDRGSAAALREMRDLLAGQTAEILAKRPLGFGDLPELLFRLRIEDDPGAAVGAYGLRVLPSQLVLDCLSALRAGDFDGFWEHLSLAHEGGGEIPGARSLQPAG